MEDKNIFQNVDILGYIGIITSIMGIFLAIFLYKKQKKNKTKDDVKNEILRTIIHSIKNNEEVSYGLIHSIIKSKCKKYSLPNFDVLEVIEDLINNFADDPLALYSNLVSDLLRLRFILIKKRKNELLSEDVLLTELNIGCVYMSKKRQNQKIEIKLTEYIKQIFDDLNEATKSKSSSQSNC